MWYSFETLQPLRISIHPFKIIHQRPHCVCFHVDSILVDGVQKGAQIQLYVHDPIQVLTFSFVSKTVFGYVDVDITILLFDPAKKLPESPRNALGKF